MFPALVKQINNPMLHLSLDSLHTFITVLDLQSFTRAGEQLGRSQPAVSLQLKKLEQLIGRPLLERQGQQLQATAAGQELYQGARSLLQQHDSLLSGLRQHPPSGQVRLGIPSEFATALLPRVLGQFSRSYPEIALEVTSALSRDLRLGASRGSYDLILTVAEQAPASAIQVKEDQLVWVGGQPLTPAPDSLPLVLAAEGCIYRRRALARLNAAQRPYRITYTNNDLTGISNALKSNLGITVLARSSVPQDLVQLTSQGLPDLGAVGIFLERHGEANDAATSQLMSYLSANLVP